MAIDADVISTQIQNMVNLARSEATSMIAAANTLVNNAVGVLTQYAPQFPEQPITIQSAKADFGGEFDATEKPPNFPTVYTAKSVTMGNLGDLDTVDDTFTASVPTLELPTFNYLTPSSLEAFSQTAPTLDSSLTVPDTPTITYPDLPTLLALNTSITLADLVLPSASFTLPTYNNILSTNFAAEFTTGRTLVPNPDDYGTQLVNRFYPGLLDDYAQLHARINGILGGTTTALTDSVDSHLYEALRTRLTTESSRAQQVLDDATLASGWEMPGLVRAAGLAKISQDLAVQLGAAALDVYGKRAERELQHLQFVMGLADKLHDSAITLFGNAFAMQIQAFQAALTYGDTASKFAVTVYQLIQRDFEILSVLVDKQIAIYNALLQAELSKVEVTKAQLAVEQLKAELNHDLIAQYTAQLQGQETKVRLYQGQVSALEATLQARKLPLEAFQANVQAFEANAMAKKSEYELLEAQISGDKAKLDGQLGKLQIYKTQADVFATQVDARSKKIAAQSQRNQQILEEFKTRLGAEVDLTRMSVDVAEHALHTYSAMANVFIAESDQKLNAAKFEFEKTLEDAKLELEQTRLDYDREFKSLEMEMTRVKATADISLAGAQVQAHVGASAMSVMNSMVQLSASAGG